MSMLEGVEEGHLIMVLWEEVALVETMARGDAVPRPIVARSVGTVIARGGSYVTLARDLFDDGDYRGVISIPAAAIYHVTALTMEDQAWPLAPGQRRQP